MFVHLPDTGTASRSWASTHSSTSGTCGKHAAGEMQAALRAAHVVVFIMSTNFVGSAYCMEELGWALEQRRLQEEAGDPAPLVLLPVFYHGAEADVGVTAGDLHAAQSQGSRIDRLLQQAHPGGDMARMASHLAALAGMTGPRQLDSFGK